MYSIIISYIYKTFQIQFKLPFLSIGTIGTALAMLISFRFKISYDRWVESNRLWILIESKSQLFISRIFNFCHLVDTDKKNITNFIDEQSKLLNYLLKSAALNLQNYQQSPLSGSLKKEEIEEFNLNLPERFKLNDKKDINASPFFIRSIQQSILHFYTVNNIQSRYTINLMNHITELQEHIYSCYQLRIILFPLRYEFFFHFLMYIFNLTLPWCLGSDLGNLVPLASIANVCIFFTLEELSKRTETPFGRRKYDVPALEAITRIEKSFEEAKEHFNDSFKSNNLVEKQPSIT